MRFKSALITAILCSLFNAIIFIYRSDQYGLSIVHEILVNDIEPVTKITTNSNGLFGKRKLCSSTQSLMNIDANFTVLQSAYAKAEAFHNGGGNLKSIETYLNNNIDITFKKHGIQFIPEGSETPLSSDELITATIIELLKKNDRRKRGGYDQRSLPGKFTMKNEGILHQNRLIEVLEPFDDTCWDFGLGPIASEVCKSIDRIRAKGGNKNSYEDKFMCSFNDMTNEISNATTEDTKQDICEIMSIGSNGQWALRKILLLLLNALLGHLTVLL